MAQKTENKMQRTLIEPKKKMKQKTRENYIVRSFINYTLLLTLRITE